MSRIVPIYTNFTAGELSPRLGGRVDIPKVAGSGCRRLENAFVHPHGGATRRSGMRFIAEAGDSSRTVRLVPFIYNVDQAYVLEFGHCYMRVFTRGGLVMANGSPVEIETPYASEELDRVQYCQSADRLYLVHRNHPPKTLSRTGHDCWTLEDVQFGWNSDEVKLPTSFSAENIGSGGPRTTTQRYKLTVVDDKMRESTPCGITAETVAAIHLNYECYNKLAWSWDDADYSAECRLYKERNGVYGYLGRSENGEYEDMGEFLPDVGTTPPRNRDLFHQAGEYPGAVTFYQQRLCFGGSVRAPMTVWLSKTSDFQNFSWSSPPRDDDSCEFMLASTQVNNIQWLVPAEKLLIGSSGAEWLISGTGGGPLTPVNVEARAMTRHGSAAVQPLVVGSVVLFVDRTGRTVREFVYSFDMDGYTTPDLSILAEHLTRSHRIIGWAYQQSPHSIIWCVRSDGALLGLTYQREHQVAAWHRHITDGEVESLVCVPEAGFDELWLVVRRTAGGVEKRFIEKLDPEFDGADATQGFFVDSGLSYDGPPERFISGLDHLEGRTVSILADGAVLPNQTVVDGRVTLPAPAGVVHAGLPYQTTIEPMMLEAGAPDGTSQGRIKRVSLVTLRFHQTLGAKAGSDPDMLDELPFRRPADPMGKPPPLLCGDVDVSWPGAYDRDARLIVRQDQPLPMTLLAIIPRVDVNGR